MSQPTAYFQSHKPSVLSSHGTRNAANTCQYFSSCLQPHHHILDVGCGPGSITATLAPFVPSGLIVGVDFSADAIAAAQKQKDLPRNCTFRAADATDLPFGDAEFDVVHTSQCLLHLPDPVRALGEFQRVLKTGGFVACREGDSDSVIIYPDHPGLQLWRPVQCHMQRVHGAHPDAGRRLVAWALEAGFEEDKIQYTAATMTYSGAERKFWGETAAQRTREDDKMRENILKTGATDEDGIRSMMDGWEAFAKEPGAVFSIICGQIVAYK